MEQRFEDISVNFVNAQADLEQREEDLKIGTTNRFFFSSWIPFCKRKGTIPKRDTTTEYNLFSSSCGIKEETWFYSPIEIRAQNKLRNKCQIEIVRGTK